MSSLLETDSTRRVPKGRSKGGRKAERERARDPRATGTVIRVDRTPAAMTKEIAVAGGAAIAAMGLAATTGPGPATGGRVGTEVWVAATTVEAVATAGKGVREATGAVAGRRPRLQRPTAP